jgi:hypothetical protein
MSARAALAGAWLVGGLGLGLGLGCGGKTAAPDQPAAAAGEPANNCTATDECDLVEACCGCNAGGKKFALRKDAVAAYEASRAERCANVMCAQMISTDPTCDAEAVCGSGNRCRVVPHMQHAK